MIHTVITCDECRPNGERSTSSQRFGGRGVHVGSVRSAADIGWVFDDNDRNICPECYEDRRRTP